MNVPPADRAWSRTVRGWWRDYWTSPQAATLRPSDRPAVWRLFGWYHRREIVDAAIEAALKPPPPEAETAEGQNPPPAPSGILVRGSTGQPKVTPLLDELRAIDSQIEALEKRVFGPPPASGEEGSGGSDGAALLAAANARFAELLAELPDDAADPRLELLEGGAREASA